MEEISYKDFDFSKKWFVFGCLEPIHPDRIRKRKNRNATIAGVKQIRVHDFRHSTISYNIYKYLRYHMYDIIK